MNTAEAGFLTAEAGFLTEGIERGFCDDSRLLRYYKCIYVFFEADHEKSLIIQSHLKNHQKGVRFNGHLFVYNVIRKLQMDLEMEKEIFVMQEMTTEKLRDFIENEFWIFAKTYAHKAPHEYIVRSRIKGSDEDFIAMVDYIQNNGITMYFWNHPNKYIILDGYQYWVMRENEEDPTTIINRCDLNEYKLSITWKGAER